MKRLFALLSIVTTLLVSSMLGLVGTARADSYSAPPWPYCTGYVYSSVAGNQPTCQMTIPLSVITGIDATIKGALANPPDGTGSVVLSSALAAAVSGSLPAQPATLADLQALPYTYAATVTRYGYSVAGDAPAQVYRSSVSACSLSSGAGDTGSQVPASGGGCWNAVASPGGVDGREWGMKCDGATDDSVALAKAFDSGMSVVLPSGTCVDNTPNYAAIVWGSGNGSNYAIGNSVTLADGVVGTIYSVDLTSLATVSGCTSSTYAVNDILDLIGGTPEALLVQVQVTAVNGSGCPTAWALLNPNMTPFIDALPTSFPTTDETTPGASGAVFASPTWGPGMITLTNRKMSSTVANPVPQASTTGFGTGATYVVTPTTGVLAAAGQALRGSIFGTTLTSNATGSVLFTLTGNGTAVRDLQINDTAMTDGWAVYVAGSVMSRVDNIVFANGPGHVAMGPNSRQTYITRLRSTGSTGGSVSLISPISGAPKAQLFEYSTPSFGGTAGLMIDDSILGLNPAGQSIALMLDGAASTTDIHNFQVNNPKSCLRMANNYEKITLGPHFLNAFNFQCQTPTGLAAFDIEAGGVAYLAQTFCNNAAFMCIFIGPSVQVVEMFQPQFNGTGTVPVWIAGQKVNITGGLIQNGGGNGVASCGASMPDGVGFAGGLCPGVGITSTAGDISISGASIFDLRPVTKFQSWGVAVQSGFIGGPIILDGNIFNSPIVPGIGTNLVGSWHNEAGANPCGSTGTFPGVKIIESGQCPVESRLDSATGTTIPASQMVAAIIGGHADIWRTGATSGTFTDTTDTAANIYAAEGSLVGFQWVMNIQNNTPNTEILAGGTGVTVTVPLQTAKNQERSFLCKVTSSTTATCVGQ